MSGARLSRRAFVAASLIASVARGKGRTPLGGKVTMHVPWPIGPIDPHRIDDPIAAIFGDALFDPLFTADGAPALADGEPEMEGTSTVKVKLRLNLKTAREKPLGTKDAVWSIARARTMSARGLLSDIPVPREDGRTLYFAMKDAARLKTALSSPLVAMLPTGYDPTTGDGTGAFRYSVSGNTMTLTRNRFAARGPAFLDEVVVGAASDMSAGLVAFEAGSDDIGWLERGLHEPRAGSKSFDYGAAGWAVLYTGRDAGSWDAPGIAQRIADGIPYARLASLHPGNPWPPDAPQPWGGPPTTLIVRDDAPWLVAMANAIAAAITNPGHEVTVRPTPAAEIVAKRTSRLYGLMLDVVRNPTGGALGTSVLLATANDPSKAGDLMAHPPKLGDVPARTLTRTLRLGVVGEIKVAGGRMPELVLPQSATGFGFDLGAAYRSRR
jgi:peptide/nickel transport system substrate-binding protein